MTAQEIIDHWRKGAQDSFEAAKWAYESGKYELSLFHCHLAMEKIFKSIYMEKKDEFAPKTHDLVQLASLIGIQLEDAEKEHLEEITKFATEARYADSPWSEEHANKESVHTWINFVENFLSKIG